MGYSGVERSWITLLVVAVSLLASVCESRIARIPAQTNNTENLLVRNPRGLLDELIDEVKKEFLAHDGCIIKGKDEDDTAKSVCITKDCTETAATLISSMDKTANPCEDFFQFTCGNYIKKHPVPSDRLSISTMATYVEFYQLLMKSIVEETDFTKEPTVVFKVQEAYHVCINTTYQPHEELKGFKRFLLQQLSGWPQVSKFVTKQPLEEFMGNLIRRGYDIPFLKADMARDKFEDPKNFVVKISGNYKPNLKVDAAQKKTGEACKIRSKINILEHIGQAVGHNVTCFRDSDHIEKINVIQSYNQMAEGEEARITVKELKEATESKFDWLKFLNAILSGIHTLKEEDIVYISSLDYLKKFAKNIEILDTGALKQYIYDVIVLDNILNGGPHVDKFFLELMRHRDPEYVGPSREKICLEWVLKTYPFILTRLVVKNYLHPRTKQEATLLVELIINAYEKTIKNSKWVDEKTKEKAITKAKSMKLQIAYPEYVLKDDQLEEKYAEMPKVYPTHIENVIALQKYNKIDELEMIKREFNHLKDWLATPLTINAGYSADFNTVVMQLGMLNLPYFNVDRIAAVNYGMIGSVIGHEIGHGFDTSGRLYDEVGRQTQWWTESTEKEYLKLTKCFIDQYSSFCPEELSSENACVKGEQTVGENMADNSGLKASFQGYQEYVKKFGAEKRLPGLQEYSPEQIFFISFAYAWCENIPIYNWRARYDDDEHSPGKYRILGALSNSVEFAEVFNCPPGPMNRDKDRCTLW